jgi:hypothetical protein
MKCRVGGYQFFFEILIDRAPSFRESELVTFPNHSIQVHQSSDQRAPGLSLPLGVCRGAGAFLLSLGDFRAPIFNFRVGRNDVGFDGFD